MTYNEKIKLESALNPYRTKEHKTVTTVYNDRLHFVTSYSYDVNSHKMKVRLKECGPFDSQSFTTIEDEIPFLIFHQ